MALKRYFSCSALVVAAGFAGGLIEMMWVSIYGMLLPSMDINEVAYQITASFTASTVNSDGAIAMGVVIHFVLAIMLAAAYTVIVLPRVVRRWGAMGILTSSLVVLATVWFVNFFVLLPIINPVFVKLMPYGVTLTSKLLFGFAMAAVLMVPRTFGVGDKITDRHLQGAASR